MKGKDKKMILELFHIPAPSGKEQPVRAFIKNRLNELKIEFTEDSMGNIYNISHTNRPMLNAHMDTVQGHDDVLLSKFIKIRNNVLSGYGVIGGDDKCGIYITLKILEEIKDVNFLFTVEEESGCNGSRFFVKNMQNHPDLNNVLYSLTLDRRGDSDILCTKNDYGTKAFEDALFEVGKGFGYKPGTGTLSDANQLRAFFSCCNLSVGYYCAHSTSEWVDLIKLDNAFEYVKSIIEEIKSKFGPPTLPSYSNSYYDTGSYMDNYLIEMDNWRAEHDACIATGETIFDHTACFYLSELDRYITPNGLKKLMRDLNSSGAIDELATNGLLLDSPDDHEQEDLTPEELNELLGDFENDKENF